MACREKDRLDTDGLPVQLARVEIHVPIGSLVAQSLMPTFLFFGRIDNGRAVAMNVKSYRWFNHGGYTSSQIDKLRAYAQELLDTNEVYETCGEVTVHELVGTTNPEIKKARVSR